MPWACVFSRFSRLVSRSNSIFTKPTKTYLLNSGSTKVNPFVAKKYKNAYSLSDVRCWRTISTNRYCLNKSLDNMTKSECMSSNFQQPNQSRYYFLDIVRQSFAHRLIKTVYNFQRKCFTKYYFRKN